MSRFRSLAQLRAVMAKLREAGLLPQRQRQVAQRPADIARVESWGDVYYQYKEGHMAPGPHLKREDLPETLYHFTTNLPRVRQSDFLIGGKGTSGMGGGQTKGVSFTTSRSDARLMQRELTRAVELVKMVRGESDPKWVQRVQRRLFDFAHEDIARGGLTGDAATALLEKAQESGDWLAAQAKQSREWRAKFPKEANAPLIDAYRMDTQAAFASTYLMGRDSIISKEIGYERDKERFPLWRKLKNPILMGRAEEYVRLNPRRFGVVAIPTARLPEDVAITKGTDDFLHEIRVHGDVPLTEAVLIRKGQSRFKAERVSSALRRKLISRRLRAVRDILKRRVAA